MKEIYPGAVETPDGTLIMDLGKLLREAGIPDTMANRERLANELAQLLAVKAPEIPIRTDRHHDPQTSN